MHTFVTDDGQKIYVNAGNCNFEVGFFVDQMSAALFECSMCHLPAFDPVRASCFHLYCRECLLNLQQKTQNCWLQMIIPTKCSKKTGAMRELTAIEDHLYQHLMVACPTCKVLISIIKILLIINYICLHISENYSIQQRHTISSELQNPSMDTK